MKLLKKKCSRCRKEFLVSPDYFTEVKLCGPCQDKKPLPKKPRKSKPRHNRDKWTTCKQCGIPTLLGSRGPATRLCLSCKSANRHIRYLYEKNKKELSYVEPENRLENIARAIQFENFTAV